MIAPRRPWSGWLDGGHLCLDAVVALVDGELADGPAQRALAHVDHCLSCAAEVTAQRQARRALRDARMPGAPTSLLSSLRAIPDSADLPPVPGTLALDADGRFVVRARGRDEHRADPPPDPSAGAAPASSDAPPAGTGGAGHPGEPDPAGTDAGRTRPSRRTRRRLAVGLPAAVASGLAVGAVTFGTPGAAPAPPAATARPAVAPRDDSTPSPLGAQLSLRRDQGSGVPGPGAP